MTDSHFPSRSRSRNPWSHRGSSGEVQYVLRAEEQLLQSISARLPLQEVLRSICKALDLEIGNMISLISLPNDEATSLAAIAKSAALFGLHKFCSAGVVGGNDELLGSLEMYCCVPRRPFLCEVKLMERAVCLAALAIKCYDATSKYGNSRIPGNRAVRTNVLEWPAFNRFPTPVY
jgi:hypothetical protein